MPGIEPGASCMQSRRSTTELHPQTWELSVAPRYFSLWIYAVNFPHKKMYVYFTLLCKYFRGLKCRKDVLCKSISLKPSDSLESDKARFKTSNCKIGFYPSRTMHKSHSDQGPFGKTDIKKKKKKKNHRWLQQSTGTFLVVVQRKRK